MSVGKRVPCLCSHRLVHDVFLEVEAVRARKFRAFLVQVVPHGRWRLHRPFGEQGQELSEETLIHVATHLVQDEPVAY